jgi:hypothetical protein
MQLVTGTCFPEGSLVYLFHVVKLVLAALQHQIEIRNEKIKSKRARIRMAKVVDKLKLERSDF